MLAEADAHVTSCGTEDEELPAAIRRKVDIIIKLELLGRAEKRVGDAVKEREYEAAFEAGPWC